MTKSALIFLLLSTVLSGKKLYESSKYLKKFEGKCALKKKLEKYGICLAKQMR